MPPSTVSMEPVTNEDSGEGRPHGRGRLIRAGGDVRERREGLPQEVLVPGRSRYGLEQP
jgi:hypothetical protein